MIPSYLLLCLVNLTLGTDTNQGQGSNVNTCKLIEEGTTAEPTSIATAAIKITMEKEMDLTVKRKFTDIY